MRAFKVALVAFSGQPMPTWVPEAFAKAGIDFVGRECRSRAALAELAGDADAVWVMGSHECLYAENLDVLTRCGAIIRAGSGTDNVPVAEATQRGILVANTPEATSDGVSDHVIGLIFALIRQIAAQDRLLRQGIWDQRRAWPNGHLRGQSLGLIGFGNISRALVKKLGGFDLTVRAFDPLISDVNLESHGVQLATLDEVLTQSDVISIHCPLTPDTQHLIGERELRLMRPSTILINTARGPIIDEPVLIRALQEGWIAAAGLDVFEQEPMDPANPLRTMDNVVLTPHIAGHNDESGELFWRLSVDTALDLAQGKWPRSCVNSSVQPRWALKRD